MEEKPEEKPTPLQQESHHFDLDTVELEFDAAREAAMEKVKLGHATAHYEFHDNIRDGDHLSHLTITALDGTIIYDQDFILEDQTIATIDRTDN